MIPLFEIRPSLRLRPAATADDDLLHDLVEANRPHLRNWLPWVDGARTVADQHAFLAHVVERGEAGHGAVWLIEANSSACGVCGFNWIEPINGVAEIGYWLAADHQGRGIITACVQRLVEHAFTDLNLNRLTIPVATENLRSRAVPERLGFRPEGVLRQAEWLYDHFVDHVLYARVKSDGTPPRPST
jgi:ribosomal-protein-serine acetyltransferase